MIKGELPIYKVYEDELTIAFIPLHPKALAHVLVVPKLQVDQFFDLPDTDYRALMATVKKVALRMHQVVKSKRVGLEVFGMDVPHAHIHVIAFDTFKQFVTNPNEDVPVNYELLKAMAEKLAFGDIK